MDFESYGELADGLPAGTGRTGNHIHRLLVASCGNGRIAR
jgi:hypothetical protein